VDRQILKLLNQRLKLAKQVGHAKAHEGKEVFAPEREAILLARLHKLNKGSMHGDSLNAIYREILSSARSMQKDIRIGCLGKMCSETHMAAREFFGASCEYEFFSSGTRATDSLSKGICDYLVGARERQPGLCCLMVLPSSVGKPFYLWRLAK